MKEEQGKEERIKGEGKGKGEGTKKGPNGEINLLLYSPCRGSVYFFPHALMHVSTTIIIQRAERADSLGMAGGLG